MPVTGGNGTVLLNGRAYSHDQIVFNMFGVPITSLSDIDISTSEEKGFNYGTGKYAVSWGTGKKNPVELSFTISKNEGVALENVADENDIKNFLPFDIPVTFLNPQGPQIKVIKNVLIQSYSEKSSVDNTDIKYEIKAIASHINTL